MSGETAGTASLRRVVKSAPVAQMVHLQQEHPQWEHLQREVARLGLAGLFPR
jgi:hypothetical protein